MSTTAHKAGSSPAAVQLEEGKTYAWCACGLSSKQPYCDGSHKTTAFKPTLFKAEKNRNRLPLHVQGNRQWPFL